MQHVLEHFCTIISFTDGRIVGGSVTWISESWETRWIRNLG